MKTVIVTSTTSESDSAHQLLSNSVGTEKHFLNLCTGQIVLETITQIKCSEMFLIVMTSQNRPIFVSCLITFSISSYKSIHFLCRNFLVAFSNSTVALISEHTVSTAEIEYVAWPQQPQFLMPLDSGAIVAACTDGTVWHGSLVDGRISSPTSM